MTEIVGGILALLFFALVIWWDVKDTRGVSVESVERSIEQWFGPMPEDDR